MSQLDRKSQWASDLGRFVAGVALLLTVYGINWVIQTLFQAYWPTIRDENTL